MFTRFKDWLTRQRHRLFPVRNVVAVVTTAPANYPLTREVLAQHLAEQLHREYGIPGLCAADIRGLKGVKAWPICNVFRCHIRRGLAAEWELLRDDLEVTVLRVTPDEWEADIPTQAMIDTYRTLRQTSHLRSNPAGDVQMRETLLEDLKQVFDHPDGRIQLVRLQVWHPTDPLVENVRLTFLYYTTPIDLGFVYITKR